MTSPIQKAAKKAVKAVKQPPAAPIKREWCCGTSIKEPHIQGCMHEASGSIDYSAPVQVIPEPPVSDPHEGSAPAASVVPDEEKPYGIRMPEEFEFITPTQGHRFRLRKLLRTQMIQMQLSVDAFAPRLMQDVDPSDGDEYIAGVQRTLDALAKSDEMFDKVIVAASVNPQLTLGHPDLAFIEIDDKLAIYNAVVPVDMHMGAQEAQQEALKSVRGEQAPLVRDLSDGEVVRAAPE